MIRCALHAVREKVRDESRAPMYPAHPLTASAFRDSLLPSNQNHGFPLQEQKEVPSSGAHRSQDLGAPKKEGPRGELAAQCDTHARIFLLQEPPVHQLRTNEVKSREDKIL